jgi:hypothetical protein
MNILTIAILSLIVCTIIVSTIVVLCAVVAAGRADRQLEGFYLETRGSHETNPFGERNSRP